MEINNVFLIISIAFVVAMFASVMLLFFVSRKSQKVMQSMLTLLTQPQRAKMADAARVLNLVLADEIGRIENNFKSMQETLAVQIESADALQKELSVRNTELVNLADVSVKKISVMSGRLENTVGGLQDIVVGTGWRDVENATDSFASRINELMNKVDLTSKETVDKTTLLQNQIDGWVASGKDLSSLLESGVQANISHIDLMKTESDGIYEKLQNLSSSVAGGFDSVKTAAANYEKIMTDNDKLMGDQLEKMESFTKQSKISLDKQANTLVHTVNVVGGQVRLAESSIEKQVRKLAEAVESLMSSATATESSVRNVSTDLTLLNNKFGGEIKEFSTSIVAELKSVSGVANITLENTRGAAAAFSESVRSMGIGVRETLMEMNTAHTQLTGQSAGLINLSAETTAQLQPLSVLIEKYYTALPELSSGSAQMAENLENLVNSLNEKIALMKEAVSESIVSVSDSTLKLEHISGQSRQQMIDLMSDYAKAVNTMQTLNKQMMVARASAPMDAIRAPIGVPYGVISSQDFITQTEKTLDKMHEQTLDLIRAVGAEVPDAVWKKYHGGDKTIFSKWFAKILSVSDKKQIAQLFKTDAVFKSQATQFVRGFAKVLATAAESDSKEMLTATLLKSDLGQIYTALKNYV